MVPRRNVNSEFNQFQQGNAHEKKDDIWDLGKGLVKLVFKHKDGSVSTVERLK